MDILQPDKFIWFFIFFIPGFISIKIYDLIIPGEPRDFSKSLFDVVAYTGLNFAAFSWLIIFIHSDNFYAAQPFWYAASVFVILFIAPILWPLVILRLMSWPPIKKYVIHPIQKPWDFVFSKRQHSWVIVHLKDRRKIGGVFGNNSFASSYPASEQIYLEQLWELDDKGCFEKPVPRSQGMLILGEDILGLEFFQ